MTYLLPRPVLLTETIGKERVYWALQKMVFKNHPGEPIVIPARFISDGLSIPRMFRNIFSKSPYYIGAGFVHDFLYRKDCPYKMTRKNADKMLRFYCKAYGLNWLGRNTIYSAVRVGAWANWKKRKTQIHK